MSNTRIHVHRGAPKPDSDGEQLTKVRLSTVYGRNSIKTVRGPLPLSIDGFRWHFYTDAKRRLYSFCEGRATDAIKAIGVTDSDRRLRGRVSQLSVSDDGLTVYVAPPY